MAKFDAALVARQFDTLAGRYREFNRRATKAKQLIIDIRETSIRCARLLVGSIDAGAFPKAKAARNGEWWDRQVGRLPGAELTVYEGFASDHQRDYGADAAKPLDPRQLGKCWTNAITSWLVPSFPERFRQGAAAWDSLQVATDGQGQPIGKDGNPLKWYYYRDGARLPDDFQVTKDTPPGIYRRKLDGELVHTVDFYEGDDNLEHQRRRAEVYEDACRLLAELTRVGAGEEDGNEEDQEKNARKAERMKELRTAILNTADGDEHKKPNVILSMVSIGNKEGRDLLRNLQKRGEYNGYTRPRSPRYSDPIIPNDTEP